LKASSLDLDEKESTTAVAYTARKGDNGKGKKTSMRCHKCGKLGHFERECHKGSQGSEGSGKSRSKKGCFTCRSPDHMKRDYLKRGKSKSSQGVTFTATVVSRLGGKLAHDWGQEPVQNPRAT
jgi:hypothetical protein